MKLLLEKTLYKILVTSMIVVLLSFFVVTSTSEAKLKIEKGQLYYTGTQEGKPIFEKGLWELILNGLAQIADYIVGIMTLGFRGVVIGWIEIMEILLTAILGLPMDLGQFIVDASNGMDGYSQQIVNVENIIFNEVPILNANIFSEYNSTTQNQTSDEIESTNVGKTINQNETGKSEIVTVIRTAVAKWYYIMRLIAIMFMLLLLLFVGIKMAISNVASEKAVYKQMLVDWVVGMILVFSIHYIMIFILNLNDGIVDSLKNINKDGDMIRQGLEYTYGEEDKIKKDKDLEVTLYEEARTRAYDIKLTNGFTGMIIYGVLVFYAWKFALVYFRRMLNIAILALLAPAVSASYAMNKVISGKAKIFSSWFSELIMNTIIQIVHALIYVSFVSMALELTRQSLSAIVLAFVLLNFMTKADKLLRQLFKLSGGEGSLAGDMADRTGISEVKNNIKSMKQAMIGGTATKIAMKATYKAAAMPIKKVGVVAIGKATEMTMNSKKFQQHAKKKKIEKYKKEREDAAKFLENSDIMKKYEANVNKYNDNIDKISQLEKEKQEVEAAIGYYYQQVDQENLDIQLAKKDEIEQKISELEEESINLNEEIEKNEQELQKEFLEQQMNDSSLKDVFKSNLGMALRNLVDVEELKKDSKNGKRKKGDKVYKRKKTGVQGDTFWERQAKRARFWDKDENAIDAKFRNDIKLQNLFGLAEDEMKLLKKITNFEKQRILGLFSTIASLPMMGINPLVGMGLLTNGMNAKIAASQRERIGQAKAGTIPNSRFKFKRFGLGAMIEFSKPETYIALETQKFEVLNHKKLEKKVKSEINRIKTQEKKENLLKTNSSKAVKEYNQKMISYENNIRNQIKQKTAQEIAFEQKINAKGVVNVNDQYFQFDTNKEMLEFMQKIDKIDSRENTTNEGKLNSIYNEMQQKKEVLIKDAITALCLEKGITDIIDVELTDKDMMDIDKNIVGILEKTGVVKKGEIDLSKAKITEQAIIDVYLSMSQDSEETNKSLENNIVQASILEYMQKNNETDIRKLKTDNAKSEICDIIKEKIISDSSKQSADVIKKISGENKLKEEIELSENMLKSIEDNSEQVKKIKKTDYAKGKTVLSKEKLIQRQINKNTNQLKEDLERALYTEETSEITTDKRKQEMFELLQQLQEDNQRANNLEFYLLESKSKKTERKYKYYQMEIGESEKMLDKYINSRDGQSDMLKLEAKMEGPLVDINELINNIKSESKNNKDGE